MNENVENLEEALFPENTPDVEGSKKNLDKGPAEELASTEEVVEPVRSGTPKFRTDLATSG